MRVKWFLSRRLVEVYRPQWAPIGFLLLSMTVPVGSQPIGAVRGWKTAPNCVSESSIDKALNPSVTDDVHDEEETFVQRARDIGKDLRQNGRAWQLADRLLRLLDGTLQFTCKDESTGEYVVRYPVGLGTEYVSDSEFDEFRFALSNLSQPMIEFNIEFSRSNDEYLYTYTLYNEESAIRPIYMWFLVAPVDDQSLELAHPLWSFDSPEMLVGLPAVAPQAALYWDIQGPELRRKSILGRWAMWTTIESAQEIQPGGRLGSFTAKSRLRPGWTTAFVAGGEYMSLPWREGGIPAQVLSELDGILHRTENKFSAVPVIGPMFNPNTPRPEVARNWIQGVRVLIEFDYLSTGSPFVSELIMFLELMQLNQQPSARSIHSLPSDEYEVLLHRFLAMAFPSLE